MSTDLVITTRVKDGSGDYETLASRTFTYTEKREFQQIVNGADEVLWDAAASGSLADFDVFVLSADQPVDVELTIGNGEATEELVSLRLAKNVALVLGSDDAYRAHGASNVWAGSLDVIDLVRVLEFNAVDATVTLSLYT